VASSYATCFTSLGAERNLTRRCTLHPSPPLRSSPHAALFLYAAALKTKKTTGSPIPSIGAVVWAASLAYSAPQSPPPPPQCRIHCLILAWSMKGTSGLIRLVLSLLFVLTFRQNKSNCTHPGNVPSCYRRLLQAANFPLKARRYRHPPPPPRPRYLLSLKHRCLPQPSIATPLPGNAVSTGSS